MDLGDIDGASCDLSRQDCHQDDSSDLQGTPSALDQLRRHLKSATKLVQTGLLQQIS